MGQEIDHSQFTTQDFALFEQRLAEETDILASWYHDDAFAKPESCVGFELEAWLLDSHMQVVADNLRLIRHLNNPLVVPELAAFNIEINGTPVSLSSDGLNRLYDELKDTWQQTEDSARSLGHQLLMIGSLPNVKPSDMCLQNMSDLKRYQALNEQVLRLRHGKPIDIDIRGQQQLKFKHDDVMLESATTSFQLHIQVPHQLAHRYYNASKILSAPLVALSANSPYMFGKSLWDESRIPMFEQAVSVGGSPYTQRVTFGFKYAEQSILDCFYANQKNYPILLPLLMDSEPEELAHLRLHNGTIWRWNRPLIGIERGQLPHTRIEQRVVPAGPTIIDSVVNLAIYIGAVTQIANEAIPAEELMPFKQAKKNFYQAAQYGLSARVEWLEGKSIPIAELLLDQIIPMARDGLTRLGISEPEQWLKIAKARVETAQNGANWQRKWVARYGEDMTAMTQAYYQHQQSSLPVHEWGL